MTAAAVPARVETPVVLAAERVSKVYPGTVALRDVDFRLERGRVHALIGENGAGKSTLLKILSGVETPTSGRVRLDGEPRSFGSAREAAACGIGLIHQELQLFPDLSVAENLFVGRERKTRWGTVAADQQRREARAVLARLAMPIDPDVLVGTLPLGQQQIVEIARALVHEARVLLMDEPTSALSAAEVQVLFQLIRDLVRHGVSIVYISHRLEELLAVADDVTVLRDGRVVGNAPASDVDVAWIVQRMTGREATERRDTPLLPAGDTVLAVDGLTLADRPGRTPLRDVSFAVRAGEIVGIYGLMGAGRTELFESLLGVHRDAEGQVRLHGEPIETLDVADRVTRGLAMVPEDRQASSLVSTLSVLANTTLSSLARLAPHGYMAPAVEEAAARPVLVDLRVKAPHLDAPIGVLSGGNQQKVVIARGVMGQPRVLLLDEPTRGVDVAAKGEILQAMRRLAESGLAVVFATSDLAEIRAATRVIVMARGRVTADLPAGEATADRLASAASVVEAVDDGGGRG